MSQCWYPISPWGKQRPEQPRPQVLVPCLGSARPGAARRAPGRWRWDLPADVRARGAWGRGGSALAAWHWTPPTGQSMLGSPGPTRAERLGESWGGGILRWCGQQDECPLWKVMSFRHLTEHFLARTRRRGGDRSTLQMTQESCDHRPLGDGGHDAEWAASATGARGYSRPWARQRLARRSRARRMANVRVRCSIRLDLRARRLGDRVT